MCKCVCVYVCVYVCTSSVIGLFSSRPTETRYRFSIRDITGKMADEFVIFEKIHVILRRSCFTNQ